MNRFEKLLLAGVMPLAFAGMPAKADTVIDCYTDHDPGPDGVLGTSDDMNPHTVRCGVFSRAEGDYATAFGTDASAVANYTIAIGATSTASRDKATTIGFFSGVSHVEGTALGYAAEVNDGNQYLIVDPPAAIGGTAIGSGARTSGNNNVALGGYALVGAQRLGFGAIDNGTAVGAGAEVLATGGTTLGYRAQATATDAVAIGSGSIADQANTVSVGAVANERRIVNVAAGAAATDAVNRSQLDAVATAASNAQSTADLARTEAAAALMAAQDGGNAASALATAAQGTADTALANAATAQSTADTARAEAASAQSTATRALANTTYFTANADGPPPVASGANSVAIGPGATASRDGQVALGGAGSSVTIGDIAASTEAQAGAIDVMTVDSTGTLGRDTSIRPAIAALQEASSAQAIDIRNLQRGQDELFDLAKANRKEARRGVAAAVALTAAPFPSAPGKTSYAANTAIYRGEVAYSASIAYRLNVRAPMALTAGISHSGTSDTAARVGVAGEF